MALIEIEGLIAFAKGLIALRTLATSGVAGEHLEALAELSTSRDVIVGILPKTSLGILAQEMANIAKLSELAQGQTGHDISDERRLFDQAMPYALRTPHLLSNALVNTDEAVEQMLKSIQESPMKPHWTAGAELYFKRVAAAALTALVESNDAIRASLPEIFAILLGSQARLESELQSFRTEARESSEKLVELMSEILRAVSSQSEGMSIQAITAIAEVAARRSVSNSGLAIRSASELMRAYAAQRIQGHIQVRVGQLTMFGALGLAASEADEKVASAKTNDQLAEALDEAALHYLMTLDFRSAARRIQRRAVLCRGSRSPSQSLLDEFTGWYERGQTSGDLIYVEIAEALARHAAMDVPTEDRWRHLLNLGVACFALASEWGPFRLIQARSAFAAAVEQLPAGQREKAFITANLGAVHQGLAHELGSPASFRASIRCFEAAEGELEKRGDDVMLPTVRHAVWSMREARSIIESLSAKHRNN